MVDGSLWVEDVVLSRTMHTHNQSYVRAQTLLLFWSALKSSFTFTIHTRQTRLAKPLL